MASISIYSEPASPKTLRRVSEEATHHSPGTTEMIRVEPLSGNTSMTTPRCPFRRLKPDQVLAHTGDTSMRPGVSGTESVNSDRSISSKPGLQEATNDCSISKHASEIKSRVVSGFAKTASDAKPRSAKRRTLKGEYLSKRRFRSRTKTNRCSKPPTDDAPDTEPTQLISDAASMPSMHRSHGSRIQHTRERDTQEIDPAMESVVVLPDYALVNVNLTEMELETCKRLDSLARNRPQTRTGGRRVSTTVAKDQNVPSARHRQPHEVEAKSRLTKVMLEPLDLGMESGDLLECSGDRAGRLTYRCGDSPVKQNDSGERTSVCPSSGRATTETDQTTRATLSGSNGLPSPTETDRRTSTANSHRIKSILAPIQMFRGPRPQTRNSDQGNSSRGDESKVTAQAETCCSSRPPDKASISNSSETAKSRTMRRVSEESHHSARSENSPRSPSCLQDVSSVSMVTNVSSSSRSSSSSSSCYDSCSEISLDTTTSRAAARGLEATSARSDRTGVEVKRCQNQTYVAGRESLDARNSASKAPDERGVLPADLGSAAATSYRRRPPVFVTVRTRLNGDRLTLVPTKETLKSPTKENAPVKKTRQKINNRDSVQEGHLFRPVRSSTIIIEPSTLADTSNVPSSVNAHTTSRLSKTNSPPSNNRTFDHSPRLPIAKLSETSAAALPGSPKDTSPRKATRSLRTPLPTKASELRRGLRLPAPCQARTSSGDMPAVDRNGIGDKVCASSRLWSCQTMQESYAQLEKVQSIPVEFRLKEICRAVDDCSVLKTNPDSDHPTSSVKSWTRGDHHACSNDSRLVSCVSDASKGTSTSAVSHISGNSSRLSARTGDAITVSSPKGLASPKTTDDKFQRQSRLKRDERFQGFVGIDLSDVGMKMATDKTVSHRDEKGESSLKSRYYGVQEISFRSTTRTFLVSDPAGGTQSQTYQRRSSKTIRRKQPKSVQSTTKRTFLVGQSCVKKIKTLYPRNFNAAGHKLRRLRSLQNTLKRVRSQYTSHANLEQRDEIPRKSNTPRDEPNSPDGYNPQSSPKTHAGSPVTTPHSIHPSEGHSDKIPRGQRIQIRSPHAHSNSPLQSQHFCSTPIMGSICPRAPLFYSPIPFDESPKRPATIEVKKNHSDLAKSRKYSPNTSYTISSSPKTPSNSLLNPLLHYAFPSHSKKESPKKVVSDRSKKDTTKDRVPVGPEALKNHGSSGSASGENRTKNTAPVDDSSKQNSDLKEATLTGCEGDVFETVDSSRAKLNTDETSTASLKCLFYKNHSQPVDATLSNGQQSKIPQACWQPFHIIPSGIDVSCFRLRIHYEEIPPRSFRYSKTHRKIIENRLPVCIRQLPKLMLRKSRVKN